MQNDQKQKRNLEETRIAVVIPVYRCRAQILKVLSGITQEIQLIFVVDDACPEKTGKHVENECRDPRVRVVYHEENKGVGGAVVTGYRQACQAHAEIIVKIDGDGQMNPALISYFVAPIQEGLADYVKGNRFFSLESLRNMPKLRLVGNSILSFVSKLSSGYWSIMDPTNGFTAIHIAALESLPLQKLNKRYFFESDILFRLGTVRARVIDMSMDSHYGDEKSSMKISQVMISFPGKFMTRTLKRFFYTYFLRDFNFGSLSLVIGWGLLGFGLAFGIINWIDAYKHNTLAPTGTIMLASLPVILGTQFIISAIHYDIENEPKVPLFKLLSVNSRVPLFKTANSEKKYCESYNNVLQ